MANKKLSQEELESLKEIQNDSSNLIFNLGQVDVQCSLLEGQRNEALTKLADLQEKTKHPS